MAVLKNDPVYFFEKGDYCKPHHIIVKGSWKEVGFDLATIGKTLDDAENLINTVHCSFVDSVKACAQAGERTLVNIKADLSKPEIHVRWFLRDVAPIPGTNHMEDRMTDFYTFGF